MNQPKYFDKHLSTAEQIFVFGITAALSVYEAFTFSGVFKFVANMQLEYMGSYSQKLSWLLSFMFYGGIIGVGYVVCKRNVIDNRATAEEQEAFEEQKESYQDTFERYRYAFMCVVIAIVFGFFGGRDFYVGHTAGAKRTVNLAALEQGTDQLPSIFWGEVAGVLRVDQEQIWEGRSTEAYIPIVSENWEPGKVAAIVVNAGGTQIKELHRASMPLRGIVGRESLPASVIEHWNSDEIPVDKTTIMLEFNKSPETLKSFGEKAVGAAFAILLLGGLLAFRARRKGARKMVVNER